MKIFRLKTAPWLFCIVIFLFSSTGCQKTSDFFPGFDPSHYTHGLSKQTKSYSSEVAIKWIDMQLRLIRTNAVPLGGLQPGRYFGYCGIALYESVLPGMPTNRTLYGQLTGMPQMPDLVTGYAYHWAACANSALADMNRNLFPTTSAENLVAIDSLENALNNVYRNEVPADVFDRSVTYGKTVAELIFGWSKTDGSSTVYPVYVPPVGPGLWVPTPPANAPAAVPYWGSNRLFISGSLDGCAPGPFIPYSTDPGSNYFKMVKEVYDVSQALTPEQTAIGLFYRDNPGFGGGHYTSIFKQIIEQDHTKLDKAAIAFAKTGIAVVDAGIGCWKIKYQYNIERPITYIRNIMGKADWNPLFGTPAFPEYVSGHSTVGGAFAETMNGFFGDHYHYTDHSYDYLGMAPRSFNSFDAQTIEIGKSRVFAGIHYTISCTRGKEVGKKIAQNINNKIRFSN